MKKIITYGTFDLLHYGHIRLLKRARALGDYLIDQQTNLMSLASTSKHTIIMPKENIFLKQFDMLTKLFLKKIGIKKSAMSKSMILILS